MTTIIVFFIVLSLLVLVHEAGHFFVARRAGAKVEEFGLGFPPRLFSVRRGETVYSFNLIPFGGFVKILGEDESEVVQPGSFGSLSIAKRAQVLAAGVIMNVVLAVVLLAIVSGIGRPSLVDETNQHLAKNVSVQLIGVLPDGPAQKAGFKNGDTLLSAMVARQETTITEVETFQEFIAANQGSEVSVLVDRQGEQVNIPITPRVNVPEGEGPIGVLVGKVGTISSPWWRALWDGIVISYSLTVAILAFLWTMITGGSDLSQIAGPVGIVSLTGDAVRLGIVYLMQFTAILSINLAILNILPFPALDGGRILFLIIEKIKGSPIKRGVENAFNLGGFALLILLMLVVTWQDIMRLF